MHIRVNTIAVVEVILLMVWYKFEKHIAHGINPKSQILKPPNLSVRSIQNRKSKII